MRISALKIKTRLQSGFIIILGLIVLVCGLSLWYSTRLWENTRYLYEHPYQVNIAVREIQKNILIAEGHLHKAIISDSAIQFRDELLSVKACETEVLRLIDTVYARYLGRITTVDSVSDAFHQWKSDIDSTFRLLGENRPADARYKVVHDIPSSTITLLNNVENLKKFALNRGITFYQSADKARDQLIVWTFIVIILIVVVMVLIFRFLYVSVALPLNAITQVLESFTGGNHEARSTYAGNNEFGVLSRSLNNMADSVQHELESKADISAIAEAMLAHDDLPGFCKNVLDTMMLKTHSVVGVVYICQEDGETFKPAYSVGFDVQVLPVFLSGTTEGELGLVIQQGSLFRMTPIPESTLFRFKSILGSIVPKEVVTLPVYRQGKVIAFFAMGSLDTYSTRSLEVLNMSEKNLNMSTNAILAFEHIRQYALKLDRQNDKLNTQSKELKMQAAELREQNTELERQKIVVEEANRLKSAFLSSMSHELRTPLNAVIALTGVLARRLNGKIPAEEYSYLEVVERNGRGLLELINDILDLSRIESGKMELSVTHFSLNSLIEEIVDTLRPLAEEKGIRIDNLVPSSLPKLTNDRDKCHHILQNILSNAVKFTHAGGVTIRTVVESSGISVSITDTGIGIPTDQIDLIFDEFRQIDMGTARKYSGTGLGLAIADKYARMIGGNINVESIPGNGSTFTLLIPFTITDLIPEHVIDLTPVTKGIDPVKKGFSSLEGGVRRILIVEDSEPVVVQLREMLKEEGYQSEIARNGFEAIEMVEKQVPDAVILDLMMPGLDGFGVLDQIRSREETTGLPVLILTAKYLEKEDLNRLAQNNVYQYLRKGDVNMNELLSHIRSMFSDQAEKKTNTIRRTRHDDSGPFLAVIDDNPDSVLTIRALLDNHFRVEMYATVEKFFDELTPTRPDLIFLDVMLPGTDGPDGLRNIKASADLGHIPVVAFTAHAMKGDREHLIQSGFDDYLSKPFDPADLKMIINKWINL